MIFLWFSMLACENPTARGQPLEDVSGIASEVQDASNSGQAMRCIEVLGDLGFFSNFLMVV